MLELLNKDLDTLFSVELSVDQFCYWHISSPLLHWGRVGGMGYVLGPECFLRSGRR